MTSRALGGAWKILLVADAGVLLYGRMGLLDPGNFRDGCQSYSGEDRTAFASTSPAAAGYLLLLARLVSGINVAFAAGALAIVGTAFRRGEAWSWYALLVSNAFAYGSPMVFDLTVGSIGPFERVEQALAVAIAVGLAMSAKAILGRRPAVA